MHAFYHQIKFELRNELKDTYSELCNISTLLNMEEYPMLEQLRRKCYKLLQEWITDLP